MADVNFYLKVAFEGITTAIGFILAIVVYLRSRKNLPNIYLATAFLCFALYTGGVLIYDIIVTGPSLDIFILIFIRVSLISIVFAGLFLFFSMQGQAHSRMWYTFKKNTYPWIGIVIAYAIFLIVWTRPLFSSDWIIIESYQPVDTRLNLIALIPLITLLVIFLVSSTITLYNYGVKKTEGLRKSNMKRFLIGVLVALGGTFVNVMGQLPIYGTLQNTISGILDLVFFAIIAMSIIVMFAGLAVQSKRKDPTEQQNK